MYVDRSHLVVLALSIALSASQMGCGGSAEPDKLVEDPRDGGAGPDAQTPSANGGSPGPKGGHNIGGAGSGGAKAVAQPIGVCTTAVSSDALHARDSAMVSPRMDTQVARPEQIYVRDLFEQFDANCGSCHVDQALGDPPLQLTADNFATNIDMRSVMSMRAETDYMPPDGYNGMPWSERDQTSGSDAIVELAAKIEAFIAQGRPTTFSAPTIGDVKTDDKTPKVSYLLSPTVGMQMTNLGNCVPDKQMVGKETDKSDALDKMFESATALPDRLDQTDLVTLDSKELASYGVVAYAPGYTLWADNAKKLRLVRVPRGQSIKFDKDKQAFSIPANTRFYKTFMKHVTDLQGHDAYRKMETRLIVSRPDKVNPDGSRTPQALFGTYAWNEAETEAVLVKDPLRNGTPFRDRFVRYVTDEAAAYNVVTQGPVDNDQALEDAHLTRTYAIPGSQRCTQCHMGSYPGNFILGFTPLQIYRRPMGQGGVIETSERDELSQLQRLIDYGLVTGMSSPKDVVLLENSQADRKPRNDYELQAQGYMVGNCAHCHNPFGFPSVTAPELRDVLNFMPFTPNGGIFQFPLEKYSPRIFRGEAQDIKIPYITPSLYDHGDSPDVATNALTKSGQHGSHINMVDADGKNVKDYIFAPWRSLIYRNVDAPFTYTEDSTIYPRMPRHTPGYDCRVRQIMGSWMVSIPAKLKNDVPNATSDDQRELSDDNLKEWQPFEEVKAKGGDSGDLDPDYQAAELAANTRLRNFGSSPRLIDCPPPTEDIVDPIMEGADVSQPAPIQVPSPRFSDQFNKSWSYLLTTIPGRSHWFITDLTDSPPPWEPRRPDWHDILVDHKIDDSDLPSKTDTAIIDGMKGINKQPVKISTNADELKALALTPQPFGIWKEDGKNCNFPSDVKRVQDYPLDTRPPWMAGTMVAGKDFDDVYSPPAETDHVYAITYGAQVYRTICYNCHGPKADSVSRNADTIADLTGGKIRVANFMSGVFGPLAKPGDNLERVFGSPPVPGLTTEDVASHYMLWMALGGTKSKIPKEVLNLVSHALVLGHQRKQPVNADTPNMLVLAQRLCGEVLPRRKRNFDIVNGKLVTPVVSKSINVDDLTALVYHTGEGDMWERLCTYNNPLPVRVLTPVGDVVSIANFLDTDQKAAEVATYDLYKRDNYNGQIGDQDGKVHQNIDNSNLAPWCVRKNVGDTSMIEAVWAAKHPGTFPPYCPPAFLTAANRLTYDDVDTWSVRGAMNAGLVVFEYLKGLATGDPLAKRQPDYDHCENLVSQ